MKYMDGLSPVELSIDNMNLLTIKTTLSGSVLSQNWPHIISSSEEAEIYGRKLAGHESSHIDNLSFKLKNGLKELSYLAVEHIGGLENKDHPQFKRLKEEFDRFQPEAVFYEGPQGDPVSLTEEQAYRFGEKAYIQHLVLNQNKDNPNTMPIKMESADIPDSVSVSEYRRLGYTDEQIIAADFLKATYAVSENIKNSPIPDSEKLARYQTEEQEIKNNLQEWYRQKGYPTIWEYLKRTDGNAWDSHAVLDLVKKFTGRNSTMNFDPRNDPLFQKMYEDSRIFRDQYIVRRIAEVAKGNNRVMVVMGSGHAVRERKPLEEFFK